MCVVGKANLIRSNHASSLCEEHVGTSTQPASSPQFEFQLVSLSSRREREEARESVWCGQVLHTEQAMSVVHLASRS
jgi:hypothetical protein